MRSDVDAPNRIAFDIEHGSQIALDLNCVNRFAVGRRQFVNLVRT